MQIELRSLPSIRPYPDNPRLNDNAVETVAASIRDYGFRQPIVVDAEGVIICGHTRYKAAQKLGLERVPVHVATELTPAQVRAYRIADNQSAQLAQWDESLLALELAALQAMNFDISEMGFADEMLQRLLAPEPMDGLTDPDQVPAPPDEAITQPGDIWILGKHRLRCGDSASVEDLDDLLDGVSIHLVHTDPPYNVAIESRSNRAIAAGLSSFEDFGSTSPSNLGEQLRPKDRMLENDSLSDEDFAKRLEAWFGNIARVLLPGRAFYLWGGYSNCANYPAALKSTGLKFSQALIWVKEWPVMGRKDFMGNHEWCFYGWREGAAHRFFGPNNATDVWSVKKVSPQSMVHLTEKPVELAERAIEYSTQAGEHVLDLFGGSGSTLIAAEKTGRRAFLMEIDSLYCDVIIQRWEQFTGKKATRMSPSIMG
ncbi:DNA modification methylase [Tuwongella immobilis]|uniref:Methyltransferase n=1 Tax=Tuwongella immobilis TaxID=692036 RepID=A0A6C2YSC1_9BACT|nr:DNA modification methylase [Tuwongella immobilis]VIP03772.1 adenine methyltransferase : ParB domain protein nuclease OS=Isosphaera pallida (strain ATCC 43644 / DSM 9630 / IS1B) GN=Isop_2445 PE=4 SV=1: ParBc: N6_N4_Mtase [Tuwongella immobilis]VTS04912.1 adenine methyltransferase : ParB domain protein nuclease OS=Isosphaera pallida (strain ATCC 43644 / DSM 9630 / IS1B) GN=Isop_2445 PE=4 SV=1: ParBc: N6_N4_Mtase [Tuwongella immobilis]